jgi:hypothetical protein
MHQTPKLESILQQGAHPSSLLLLSYFLDVLSRPKPLFLLVFCGTKSVYAVARRLV